MNKSNLSTLFSNLILWIILFLITFNLEHTLYGQHILKGTRISSGVSAAQLDFINEHFDFVMTPFLSEDILQSIQNPELFLYRSIQGTWTHFNQFDWDHINSHENMFCHSDSVDQSVNTRILTAWNSWLMDGNDMVEPSEPDALTHWVNYYAITSAGQVYENGFDGLFIDSAGHRLGENAVFGIMPYNYSDDTWRDGRYAALDYIKSQLLDKTVIFNGLHSENGADSSLTLTDGGMWEDFVYDINDGHYKGIGKWMSAIDCMQNNKEDSRLILVVKKPGLEHDIQARLFSIASYLLVKNSNVGLALQDFSYESMIQYYPEYDISLGSALSEYAVNNDTVFTREYEEGMVILNPTASTIKTYNLEKEYFRVIPVGGGPIDASGTYTGTLTYEKVDGQIEIPAVSAVILVNEKSSVHKDNVSPVQFTLAQNYPNPFNPVTSIAFTIDDQSLVKLKVYDCLGRELKTLFNRLAHRGSYTVSFNGDGLASGYYVYQLTVGDRSVARRMLLMK